MCIGYSIANLGTDGTFPRFSRFPASQVLRKSGNVPSVPRFTRLHRLSHTEASEIDSRRMALSIGRLSLHFHAENTRAAGVGGVEQGPGPDAASGIRHDRANWLGQALQE